MTPDFTPWQVMVVDDEATFRNAVTRLLSFEGRLVETLQAASGVEARQPLGEHDDIAVIKALRGYRDILRVTHSLSAGPDFPPTEARITAECDRMLAIAWPSATQSTITAPPRDSWRASRRSGPV